MMLPGALIAEKSYANESGDVRYIARVNRIDETLCYLDENGVEFYCTIEEFARWAKCEWRGY